MIVTADVVLKRNSKQPASGAQDKRQQQPADTDRAADRQIGDDQDVGLVGIIGDHVNVP